ncbi:MAG: HAD family hydrolase [Anaerolineales bacterium]|nr:HAD family hydrolase [Anaerolineales bacterium]MCK5634642.1 HAD family hydrolase [Anaerolineales bacterium]
MPFIIATMIEIIAFDADDTLWENESLYHRAKGELAQILSPCQEPNWVSRKLDEIEVSNLQFYGYGIKSFTLSMIETAAEAVDGKIEAQTISAILEIAKRMLSADVELLDHTEQTLSKLDSDYDLMLVTKGDLFEQQRKIERSGIDDCFKVIEVVATKTPASYLDILKKHDIDVECFLMVGNSLRSDIIPVIAIGSRAVYIPNENTWFHEVPDQEEVEGAVYDQLEHLGQLPEYITALERALD